jgi:hypothetical protein
VNEARRMVEEWIAEHLSGYSSRCVCSVRRRPYEDNVFTEYTLTVIVRPWNRSFELRRYASNRHPHHVGNLLSAMAEEMILRLAESSN